MTLKAKQLSALAMLMTTSSIQQVADAVSVNKTTIYRWMQHPDWPAAATRVRKEHLELCLNDLPTLRKAAVSTLILVMNTPEAHPSTRVEAAKVALGHFDRHIERFDKTLITDAELNQAKELLEALKKGSVSVSPTVTGNMP